MGKHLSAIKICLGRGVRNYYGIERVPYTLEQYGVVLKSGVGWGPDGAWAAANKALKRLIIKDQQAMTKAERKPVIDDDSDLFDPDQKAAKASRGEST